MQIQRGRRQRDANNRKEDSTQKNSLSRQNMPQGITLYGKEKNHEKRKPDTRVTR